MKGCSAVIESGQVQGGLLAAAYAQRGFVFTLKRNLEQAQKDLDQAIKIAPDYAEAYVNRANFWTVTNQPERAIADAERALKLAPKAPLAYFVRAGGEAKLGQYDKAIADYTEVLRLNPDAGASVYGPRGHAYYRERDYDRAIADYSEQIKLNPDDVGAYLNRGDALRSKGELASAGEDYGQAIRLAPDNPGGFGGRGQIRLFTHDFSGAVADFDAAIRINPERRQQSHQSRRCLVAARRVTHEKRLGPARRCVNRERAGSCVRQRQHVRVYRQHAGRLPDLGAAGICHQLARFPICASWQRRLEQERS